MKDSEELAFTYLSSLGFSSITYEPEGKARPPDFLVDGRIAIEVRRLNQNVIDQTGSHQGIETDQFALLRCIANLLPDLGSPKSNQSWFVHYRFSRPIPPLNKLRRAVHTALAAFRDGLTNSHEISITKHFKIDLTPSTKVFQDFFVLGGSTDRNAGGWLVYELERNIRICSEEKLKKIANIRPKYPEWWLLLIDHIGLGRSESLNVQHNWDKVVIISPAQPIRAYEI